MNIVLYVLLAFTAFASVRLVIGPTLQDRLLSLNMVSSIIILILGLLAIGNNRSFYLDGALIYAILSFTEIIAFQRFYRMKE